ncbi:MAG: bifunctional adenosylcobinamide kinase/adenosylcobinamide-phosphate guanylyltransferase [Ilumatobacteraceae bacterium]
MLTLLLGGARSGKSTLAVEIGRRHDGPVTFVATSEPIDGDMSDRIARHRAERPGWPTMEEPLDLAGALTAVDDGNLVIVDCLTLWVGNLLHRGDDDVAVEAQSAETAAVAARRTGPTVVVTNEVGLGVHPETALGMRYRDLLGRVNQQWAAAADTSLLLVAGRALALTDPWLVLT